MSSFIKNALRVIADQLSADLAPLSTAHFNSAEFRVEIGVDSKLGYTLDVYAPIDCEIFVPKTYRSFAVRFFAWENKEMNTNIEIIPDLHGIYA